ncbi:MAG: fasciclin domain-containing protein [Saprospiraceae bacterium]|nr:fasciclin domain-containing protein [Saprospiraceae bacterium]
MKNVWLFVLIFSATIFMSCGGSEASKTAINSEASASAGGGQSSVNDDVSQKDVVKVAIGSPDHTTLVKAVQAAELVDVLSNAGPFTVFAPTNAAFNQLPAGTVEGLLKPDKKNDLADILQYHVTVSALEASSFKDGQTLGMVNGGNAKITVKDGKVSINDANIVASVKASNGMVHVIDKVLLPPKQ